MKGAAKPLEGVSASCCCRCCCCCCCSWAATAYVPAAEGSRRRRVPCRAGSNAGKEGLRALSTRRHVAAASIDRRRARDAPARKMSNDAQPGVVVSAGHASDLSAPHMRDCRRDCRWCGQTGR
eukprot:352587-Chlamydomonas_euryale.AAC.11